MMSDSPIFNPISLNNKLFLKNRIVMAPMTRAMADSDGCPTLEMKVYYEKRADAGLIITEGTIISHDATGYKNVPGIYTTAQRDAWRLVTDSVHDKGGHIFCQIWHVGRVSHPSFLNGALPISPSKTLMTGRVKRETDIYYGESREATLHEIETITNQFVSAATLAIEAGFDGIELHGANGYLIDQFLHFDTNHRQDKFGETPENMTRFALDIIKRIADQIGEEKIGIRLSPAGYLNEVTPCHKDKAVFIYLLNQLTHLNLAYIHTGAFDDRIIYKALDNESMTAFMRAHYHKTLIASGSYDLNQAEKGLKAQNFDMLSFGRPFIANPDLITRIKQDLRWHSYDPSMLETLI